MQADRASPLVSTNFCKRSKFTVRLGVVSTDFKNRLCHQIQLLWPNVWAALKTRVTFEA